MAGDVPAAVLREMRARLNNMAFRGVVSRVRDHGSGLMFQVQGRENETRDDVVAVYPFGFDAWPIAASGGHGPEGIVIQLEGNSRAMLPPMDRRHRAKSGVSAADMSAIYTTKARVLIKENGDIEVSSPGKVRIVAPEEVEADTPLFRVTGDIVDNTASGNTVTMRGSREIYDTHDHDENDNGGPTGTPNQTMG